MRSTTSRSTSSPTRSRSGGRRANPRAALVVDDYDEDWTRLAYVLVRGPARVVDEAAHAAALRLLRARYPQYGRMALDDPAAHPVVRIEPTRIVVWRGG